MSSHNKNTQLLFLTTFCCKKKLFLNLINFWLGWLLKFILNRFQIFLWLWKIHDFFRFYRFPGQVATLFKGGNHIRRLIFRRFLWIFLSWKKLSEFYINLTLFIDILNNIRKFWQFIIGKNYEVMGCCPPKVGVRVHCLREMWRPLFLFERKISNF